MSIAALGWRYTQHVLNNISPLYRVGWIAKTRQG